MTASDTVKGQYIVFDAERLLAVGDRTVGTG